MGPKKKTSAKKNTSAKKKTSTKPVQAAKESDEKEKTTVKVEDSASKPTELSEEQQQKLKEEEEARLKEEEEAKLKEEEEKQKRLDSFHQAGKIFKDVVEFITPQIKVGAKVLELCEAIENKITSAGGEIGFPPNICINDIAAHYSPAPDDETVIQDGDLVKVDLGVAVEGYVVDGAFSVCFNDDAHISNLITAVDTAVLKGLSMIKPGVKTNEIGKVTSEIIKGFGYNVIKDLSGHKIEQWELHAGKEIPNIAAPNGDPFEEGEVFALECFASTGIGNIHRGSNCNIYSIDISSERVPLRGKITRKVLSWIIDKKKTLPFSTRELLKEFRTGRFALRELSNSGKLLQHYVLREKKGQFVAQREHTFLVTADGIENLTG